MLEVDVLLRTDGGRSRGGCGQGEISAGIQENGDVIVGGVGDEKVGGPTVADASTQRMQVPQRSGGGASGAISSDTSNSPRKDRPPCC